MEKSVRPIESSYGAVAYERPVLSDRGRIQEVEMARRLLIVDDEKDMADLLKQALTRAGHDAIAVTSVREALDLVASEDIEVVLTDLGMSEMNGLNVCERVIGTQPDIPVIVVTGQST